MLIRNGEKVESEFETAASKNVKPWARARGGGGGGGGTRDKKGWTSRVGLANRLPQKDKW